MINLTIWKKVLLVIIGLYIIAVLGLFVLNRLHVISLPSLQPHSTSFRPSGYVELTNLHPVPSGNPYLQPVQPPGTPYATYKLFGTVTNLTNKGGQIYFSLIQHDNELVQDQSLVAPNAVITILHTSGKDKGIQPYVKPDEIRVGDSVEVTYEIDMTNKVSTISAVNITR